MDTRIYSPMMIKNLKNHLEKNSSRIITYPKFIFLCGKHFDTIEEYSTSNRGVVDNYIQKISNNVFIVLSEKLWENSFAADIDLLTFEEFLAEISDDIILFVESPGAFCELGAFSYANGLFSNKLTIVIDPKYKGDDSFIMKGPTKKAEKNGSNIIYAKLNGTGLLANTDLRLHIQNKIATLTKPTAINKKNINIDKNCVYLYSFIIEILELIKLVQPITKNDLLDIYKTIKGFDSFTFVKSDKSKFHSEIKLEYIYKLLNSIGLIQYNDNIITTENHKDVQNLMFKFSNHSENRERNRLICRKFRYGEKL